MVMPFQKESDPKIDGPGIRALRVFRDYLIADRTRINEEIGTYPHPIPVCDAQFNYLLGKRAKIVKELHHVNAIMAKYLSDTIEIQDVEQLITSSSLIDDEMADRLRIGFMQSNG